MPNTTSNRFPQDAERFAHEVNNGGTSYSLLSHQFMVVGKDHGYMIGGHPSARTGARLPEVIIHRPEMTAAEAGSHVVKTALNTSSNGSGDPTAYVGGWNEKTEHGGRVVLDASTRETNKAKALQIGRARKERALFDVKGGEEIPTGVHEENEAPPESVEHPLSLTTKNKRGATAVITDWVKSSVPTGAK